MNGNDSLTIYTKGVNAATRSETWTRSQVSGVIWEDRRASNVLRMGKLEADRVYVYIPLALEVSINPGDVIVRGAVDDEISASFTIGDLKAKYPQSAAVRGVDRFDRGSVAMRHLLVGAS